ncbi:MAG: hypothetical protein Q8936_25280 [Bacillota bacterium]|nr:hypothetical protein [Bacillota bacterium]
MSNLSAHEKAQLTVKALQERKKKKLNAEKEANQVKFGRVMDSINKHNKRFY